MTLQFSMNLAKIHSYIRGLRIDISKEALAEVAGLPRPWDQVTIFLKKYITCEGRYRVFYTYDCFLLFHLCSGRLLNMPFYLLRIVQNMAHYARMSQHQLASITDHGLIKLLVLFSSWKSNMGTIHCWG